MRLNVFKVIETMFMYERQPAIRIAGEDKSLMVSGIRTVKVLLFNIWVVRTMLYVTMMCVADLG